MAAPVKDLKPSVRLVSICNSIVSGHRFSDAEIGVCSQPLQGLRLALLFPADYSRQEFRQSDEGFRFHHIQGVQWSLRRMPIS
jgi:hypothetical protein